MIISHSHRFIFVRCRKTASTATEIHLSRYVGETDVVTSFCERDEQVRVASGGQPPQNTNQQDEAFFNHMPAEEIQRLVGDQIWSNYFRFCFERNPWEKAISLYFHRYRTEPRISFDDFLDSGEVLDARNIGLYTINGQVVVNFIGRYEYLDFDLRYACKKIGIPSPEVLPKVKAQFRTDRRSYLEFLTLNQRQRIRQMFRDEIELLHYYD